MTSQPQPLIVKICGLNAAAPLAAALDAGADLIGFVSFPPSPRHIGAQLMRELGRRVEKRARKVILTVDASDESFDDLVETLEPDILQLHGSERPERVTILRARYGLPVIKAIGVSNRSDLSRAQAYVGVADMILLDAKPAPGASRPGGNGRRFDWGLAFGFAHAGGWLLSGGLDVGNVLDALSLSGAPGVDISSGVERAPGVKDPDLIARFVAEARRVASGGRPISDAG